MARRRRGFEPFSLSFLDAMSCGLGAVILVFMIINHASERTATGTDRDVNEELSQLEQEVLEKRSAAAKLAAALKETQQKLRAAKAESASLKEIIEQEDDSDQEVRITQDNIKALKAELKAIEKQVATLREKSGDGTATRRFEGEGQRQYLTGLSVSGDRILILVDSSASMLAERVVDIIRRRNMSEAAQKASEKWSRAVRTVDWLTTQIPVDSKFQLLHFSNRAKPVLAGTDKQWQSTEKGERLNEAMAALREITPKGGSNLAAAFQSIDQMSPKPDAVFLLTDGLPTQDAGGSRSGMVSGRQRLKWFAEATRSLPKDLPVNVILFPMEGDPLAASSYWQLAQVSGGSFMSPSRDWP